MWSPVHVTAGVIIDMRSVPLLIGTLYGGWKVSLVLAVILLFNRLLIGGVGIYSGIMLAGIIFSFSFFSKRFLSYNTPRRMACASVLMLMTCFIGLFILQNMNHLPLTTMHWIVITSVNMAGILVLTFGLETMFNYKKLYQQLIIAEKTDTANAMAVSIAHEIRNPLTVIRGFLQLLNDKETMEDKKRYIEIALKETRHADTIINNYLSFSKQNSTGMVEIDCAHFLQQLKEMLVPFANMNQVNIIIRTAHSRMNADPAILKQILVNICKNSIEAMPHGGDLTIATSEEVGRLSICIQDTGVGMSNHQLERLGESYYSTKGAKGTGLGLMVVNYLVSSMRGSIKFHSVLGKGTTVTLVFPIDGTDVS
jgi:two-component system sporulation sensor kinase B